MEKEKMFETKVLLLGADDAGKTTLLYRIKLNQKCKVIPTIGFNIESINYKDKSITIWDVGGGSKVRNFWKHYITVCNYVVFVLDLSNKSRMDYSLECFNFFMELNKNNIPFIQDREYFKDLIGDNNILRYDFILLKNNKPYRLIEYDGEQHFKPIGYFGGEERFAL